MINATTVNGGAIYCDGASPTIMDCKIESGGGIYCDDAAATITGCEFVHCAGNAILGSGAPARIEYCRIEGNWEAGEAGIYWHQLASGTTLTIEGCVVFGCAVGIQLHTSEAEITQCTIAHNEVGIELMYSTATVENSILWGNDYDQIILVQAEPPSSSIVVECSDVEGGWPGDNNIDAAPQFCNPADGDYHLAENSPCAPEQQPICGLIGALGVGCECTWIVHPDGSGDFETIQDAIDAAWDGCVICLGDGTFGGTGNRDLDFQGKAITIRSQSRNPAACVIDCQGSAANPHRGFYFHGGEDSYSTLVGISIVNGYADNGGGIYCTNSSSPTITGCVISGNYASNDGGAICTEGASATILHSTVSGNRALGDGGGIYQAGGIHMENTILWGNCADETDDNWYCWSGSIYAHCCDIEPDQIRRKPVCQVLGWSDIIEQDPLFCDPEDCHNSPTAEGNYRIDLDSPCADDPQCGLIGVLPAIECFPQVCGNGILEGTEECDTPDDTACPGECIPPGEPGECTCGCPENPQFELIDDEHVAPDGAIDARKPHRNNSTVPCYGFGMPDDPATGTDESAQYPIVIDLGVTGASDLSCWSLCETPDMNMSVCGSNSIVNVVEGPAGVYAIELAHGLGTDVCFGSVTTIQYNGGDYVTYIRHPANVNGSSFANADDIIALIDCLNAPGSCENYEADTDASGIQGAADIIEEVDLLNGAGAYCPWFGTQLPENNGDCP